MSNPVGVIVLAAGGSNRMGRPKQILPYRGRSLLRHAIETAAAAGCAAPVVVLGYDPEGRLAREVAGVALRTVFNEYWPEGMGTSIAAGVAALAEVVPAAEAALLMTCDQPQVTAGTLRRLVDAWSAGGAGGRSIAACAYAGTLGVPAVFGRKWFPALLGLRERGAKHLIEANPHEVVAVAAPEASVDLDTPQDYEACRL